MNSSGRSPGKSSRTCSRSESAATSGDRRSSSMGARRPPILDNRGSGKMGEHHRPGMAQQRGQRGLPCLITHLGEPPPHPSPTLLQAEQGLAGIRSRERRWRRWWWQCGDRVSCPVFLPRSCLLGWGLPRADPAHTLLRAQENINRALFALEGDLKVLGRGSRQNYLRPR